jgi:putative peptidoglycan lipid II flippase
VNESLTKSAGLIGAATFTSRVLGLVRDQVQAFYFGTGLQADAFVVATRLPTLLRDLFAEGAMSAAFVPTLGRALATGGKTAAWRLGAQVTNGLLLVTGALVLVGMAFAAPLATAYAGSYAEEPGKLELTILLTRVNMPFLLLVAVAASCMGMLNAMRRFLAPAVSPVMFNVVFILCTALGVPLFTRLGIEPVMALSLGMILGGVAQIAIQVPALMAEGYRHQWILDPRDAGLREMLGLMGPGTLGAAAAQVNLLVNTSLATGGAGEATALGLAFRLMYMPIGIVGVSVATAALPEFSRQAADGALDRMRGSVSWALRLMLALSVPATVGLMVLASPIVELIFEYGRFDDRSTAQVAAALLFYAPGIVGYSLVKIAAPGFYALRDARTPVVVSVLSIGLNLGLNIWLYGVMGFTGLALGTALASLFNGLALLALLGRRIGGIESSRVGVAFAKITAASAAMGLAAWWVAGAAATWWPDASVSSRMARVAVTILAAVVVLAAAAQALAMEEFRQAVARVAARWRK